jgi:signal transduction histidine kinase
MASGIADDLNQSLMLIASYSDLARTQLEREGFDLADLREMFRIISQAALDGGETVKRLLLFTRGPSDAEAQPIDLTELVHEVARLTAPRWRDATQAEGRPVSLLVGTRGAPVILGSAARLREALTNLVFNAVDALPDGGTIRLRVAEEAGRAVLEVIDTGLGMSPEVQARIFEPFFSTKGEAGTGLGLPMVFGVVERHGGQIQVESSPGRGTTFRLGFPTPSTRTMPPALSPALRTPPARVARCASWP